MRAVRSYHLRRKIPVRFSGAGKACEDAAESGADCFHDSADASSELAGFRVLDANVEVNGKRSTPSSTGWSIQGNGAKDPCQPGDCGSKPGECTATVLA